MLLLGIDIGTSSVKVSVVDAATQKCLATSQFPENEAEIISKQTGWAEQSPEGWWEYAKTAIQKNHASGKYNPRDIKAIGIAYQMHGLVLVDKDQNVLRDSIIWCDSRAVELGNSAFKQIGEEKCLDQLLNSPGNFTASKLAWVKNNEPNIYRKIDKMMLPGDFIAMKLTGTITTTVSALSEGVFWDFRNNEVSKDVMNHFGFDENNIPASQEVFSIHGLVSREVADALSLTTGIPVSYKAGDQLNNALSLNVFQPGEVAASAGTSGVIYAVTDQLFYDRYSRVNAFAHVNYKDTAKRLGVLLCINGAGSMNRWIKQICGDGLSYSQLNQLAAAVPPGSEGLIAIPFGNGAERILQNNLLNAQILNIDLNKHIKGHLIRAVQEGICFAFRYGIDIMRENNLHPSIIRAGRANMFLSDVFVQSFVNATGVPVELYNNDGSIGAALGAGIGAGIFKSKEEAFTQLKPIMRIDVTDKDCYNNSYRKWKNELDKLLS